VFGLFSNATCIFLQYVLTIRFPSIIALQLGTPNMFLFLINYWMFDAVYTILACVSFMMPNVTSLMMLLMIVFNWLRLCKLNSSKCGIFRPCWKFKFILTCQSFIGFGNGSRHNGCNSRSTACRHAVLFTSKVADWIPDVRFQNCKFLDRLILIYYPGPTPQSPGL
jgi:hypothetical protein